MFSESTHAWSRWLGLQSSVVPWFCSRYTVGTESHSTEQASILTNQIIIFQCCSIGLLFFATEHNLA